jgi:WG containing repeat
MRNLFLVLVLLAASGAACAQQDGPTAKLVPFQKDDKWGYKDSLGQVVIPLRFGKAGEFHNGLAAVATWLEGGKELKPLDVARVRVSPNRELRWGFIDQTGNTVISPQFAGVGQFSEGLAAVTRELPFGGCGCWGYIDRAGKFVIKPQFDRADPFSEGLALVWGGGFHLYDPVVKAFVSMGYIDKSGKWVIKSRYEYLYYNSFSEGLAPFLRNLGKWGYINRSGRVAIKPKFDWAGSFSGGLAPVLAQGVCSFIDKSGKTIPKEQPQQTGTSKEAKIKQSERSRGTLKFNPYVPPCP